MKRLFLFSLIILATVRLYPISEQFTLTETISLLQAYMNGKLYVQENRYVSFHNYENLNIFYEKSLDTVYQVLQECTEKALELESYGKTTSLISDYTITLQNRKLLHNFTEEQKAEFQKKKRELINRLTQENGKFEIIFRAFQEFILNPPEKQILIQQLIDLNPKMFKSVCNNSSAEECAEKILSITENRKQLKHALDAKSPKQINEACRNLLVVSGENELINDAIERIKRKLNK